MSSNKCITYQLHITIKKPIRVIIGKLGVFDFAAGQYIYTGSARRNIEARIHRHLSQNKKLRWHIDYLLHAPHVMITEVKKFHTPECELNQKTKGTIFIKKFGASDCKLKCMSHLKVQEENPHIST